MTEMTGGEVVARMLQAEGVEKVFGIIDGTYFGFYSALHRLGIEIVTPRHETSRGPHGRHLRAADRQARRLHGQSNGPGVANLLPGLVVEQAEGNRVLAITSARRPGIMYPDRGGTYQCFDQSGVIGKIAKWSEAASRRSSACPNCCARRCARAMKGGPAWCISTCPRTS